MPNVTRTRVFNGFVSVDQVDTGGERPWLVINATDSVAFLVHNLDMQEVLLVTQDRPAMISVDNPTGTITEAAAGRFDKNIGVDGLILDELEHELGVIATADQIEHINQGVPLALSPGVLTERQYLAYVAVRQDQIDPIKRVYGDPTEGESIIRRFVKVSDLEKTDIHDMKLFALVQWFLRNKVLL